MYGASVYMRTCKTCIVQCTKKRHKICFAPFFQVFCYFLIPTQLYSISDIQTVSYCRGYLSGTVQASDTSVTISYLQDLFDLKSIDFKPQKDNQHQPLYI